jgi:hypothetical protein
MSERILSRSRYEVTSSFVAFVLQREQGFAPTPHTMKAENILFADPEFDRKKMWEGETVVIFLCETEKYCVSRETFLRSTRRAELARFPGPSGVRDSKVTP